MERCCGACKYGSAWQKWQWNGITVEIGCCTFPLPMFIKANRRIEKQQGTDCPCFTEKED